MSNDTWYRNQKWTPEIEAAFFVKLGRARQKAQYLKIQAQCLAHRNPKVALMLLEAFFTLREDFFLADALVVSSEAHLALGQTTEAIADLKKALQREREVPNLRTSAWFDYVLLVAGRGIAPEYDDALRVLEENRSNLIVPSLVFAWHASRALISAEIGKHAEARDHAQQALAAADRRHSGLTHHSKIGLVGPEQEPIVKNLRRILKPSRWRWLRSPVA